MERFEAEAFDLSFEGLGVAKSPQGMICFVPGLWKGERANLEIVKKDRSFAFARVLEILTPSPHRIDAPCPYQGFDKESCGGCPWQFIAYEAQLEAKESMLASQLKRAKLEHLQAHVESIVPSDQELSYRNRVGLKTDGVDIGFLASNSNELVPVDDCLVLNHDCRSILKSISGQMPREDWKRASSGALLPLEFDDRDQVSQIKPGSRLAFRQGNDFVNASMRRWLFEELEALDKGSPILELFCGDGNLTGVAQSLGFAELIGVESDNAALSRAAESFTNFRFFECDLYDERSWPVFLKSALESEILLLDPPRSGFKALSKLLEKLPSLQSVFYVSCNLTSWISDVSELVKLGWECNRLQPFDMFPQTPHFELVSKFSRPDS